MSTRAFRNGIKPSLHLFDEVERRIQVRGFKQFEQVGQQSIEAVLQFFSAQQLGQIIEKPQRFHAEALQGLFLRLLQLVKRVTELLHQVRRNNLNEQDRESRSVLGV